MNYPLNYSGKLASIREAKDCPRDDGRKVRIHSTPSLVEEEEYPGYFPHLIVSL